MNHNAHRALTVLCLASNGSRPPTGQRNVDQLWEAFQTSTDRERDDILFGLLLDCMRKLTYMHIGSYESAQEAAESGMSARAVLADRIIQHEDAIRAAGDDWADVIRALIPIISELRTEEVETRRQELLRSFRDSG